MASMEFKKIRYIRWAKANWGQAKYDLADTAAIYVPPEYYENIKVSPFSAEEYKRVYDEFVEAISRRYGCKKEYVYPCQGTSLGLFMVFAALLNEGEEILLEIPNYEPLYRTAKLFTKNIKVLEREFEKGFQIDLELVARKVSENTKAIIISNLHNPSGVLTPPEKLEILAKIAEDNDAFLICYEIFIDQTFGKQVKSASVYGRNVITVSSFARMAGLKGMKVGWITARNDVLEKIMVVDDHLSVDMPYQSLLTAVNICKELDRLIYKGEERLTKNLAILEEWVKKNEKYVRWVKPDGGAMAFLRLLGGIDSFKFATFLQKEFSTLVVPGDFYWAAGFIRICFGVKEDVLVQGLENISKAFEAYFKHFTE
jgi:aspartate/methionine/tyrosine aminotransferase